jgi:hypothetical protein
MIIRTFIFALIISSWAHAEEVIPGILTFTPPASFGAFQPSSDSGDGDNPFSGVGQVREYLAPDGSQIDINVRLVGFSIGEGKGVAYRQLDDAEVKQEMLRFAKSHSNITNTVTILETKLDDKKAFSFTFHVIVGDYATHIDADFYWVRIDTNRVVEVELSAHSDTALVELRKSLSGFKIKKSYSK